MEYNLRLNMYFSDHVIIDVLELRSELEALDSDVVFTTDSDCEILLHLYKYHGPEFLKKVS